MKTLIKIGGSLLESQDARLDLAKQIASLAGETVVVHGGGKQMTRFLEERGIESRFVRGLRVTTEETIDGVLKVFAGTVNTQLVASLCVAGARAVGLTGVDSGIAIADQLDPELGFVGRVYQSDPRLLDTLTAAQYLPVVACIAAGTDGGIYNVNGDSMAVAVASAWAADRLLFLTDVEGVLDASKTLLPRLTPDDCAELIRSGVASGGMQAKLNACTEAVRNGVKEVRIVKGSNPDVIGRVFAGDAVGTVIQGSQEKQN